MPEAPSAGSSGGRGGEERALQLPAPALLFGPAGPSLDELGSSVITICDADGPVRDAGASPVWRHRHDKRKTGFVTFSPA